MSANTIEKEENGGAALGRSVTYSLSQEQFEKLYLQPGGRQALGDLSKRFGNPTPLGVASFLLCLTPFSCELMGFAGASANAAVTLAGAAYFVGGLGLFVAGLLEFVLGNTFPMVVFCTFGSFWASLGFLISPTQLIESAVQSADYNKGVALYLTWYAVLVMIYFVGSLRTNVIFAAVFFFLEISFWFQIAAYLHLGNGVTGDVINLLKWAGIFGFLTAACGWYLLLVLILGSTGIPITLPVGDLSNFMSGKPAAVKAA